MSTNVGSFPDQASIQAQIQPGFLEWVAALVHGHRATLISYARRHGLDAEDALDAVQDSFLSFLRLPEARDLARKPEDSLRMLTAILRNDLQNRRRKRTRHRQAQTLLEASSGASDEATSEALIANTEAFVHLHGCIQRLPTMQRSVVSLSLLDDQPHEAVAKILGIKDGYVRVLLHRARAQLQACTLEYEAMEQETSRS